MFDHEYCDWKCLGGYIVLKNILAMSKWSEMFEACQTGRKCSSHLKLARNISVVPEWLEMFQACHTTQKYFSLVTWLEHFLPVSQGIWGPSFKKKNLVFWHNYLNILYIAFFVSY